jgi:hypothetical protein
LLLAPCFFRTNSANGFEGLDGDALLGEAGKEAAGSVRRPAHRLGDLGSTGAFVTAQHCQELGLL